MNSKAKAQELANLAARYSAIVAKMFVNEMNGNDYFFTKSGIGLQLTEKAVDLAIQHNVVGTLVEMHGAEVGFGESVAWLQLCCGDNGKLSALGNKQLGDMFDILTKDAASFDKDNNKSNAAYSEEVLQ